MRIQAYDAAGEGLGMSNVPLLALDGPEPVLVSRQSLGGERFLEAYDLPPGFGATRLVVVMNESRFDPILESMTFFDGAARILDFSEMWLSERDIGFYFSSLLSGADTVLGARFDDLLRGFRGDDRLLGGGGSDRMLGEAGHDLMRGGRGNDDLFGGSGSDRLEGGGGTDRIVGGSGTDMLIGGGGGDGLSGGAGADDLRGGGGGDVLDGGGGNDVLTGGAGADVFILRKGQGRDVLTDFAAGIDVIEMHGTTGFDGLQFSQVNSDVRIEFGRNIAWVLDHDLDEVRQTANFDFY